MEESKLCGVCRRDPCECKCEECNCDPCECVTIDDVDDKVDALINLLIKKGVISEEEFEKAGEDLYEEEKASEGEKKE